MRLHSFDALADSWWCHRIAEDQQVEASLKLPRAGEGIGSQSEKGQQLTVGNNLGEQDTQSEDESEQAISKLILSKSRKRIVVRRQMRGKKVHCPKGKICELVCKGNGACSSLKGGTGQWSKVTCRGRSACSYARLPQGSCPKGSDCELRCEGEYACRHLKTSGAEFTKMTCDGLKKKLKRNGKLGRRNSDGKACMKAELPNCPKGRNCQLKCRRSWACHGLKGSKATGHWGKIVCERGHGTCWTARLPNCPKDKTCKVVCNGNQACGALGHGQKRPTGHYEITCTSPRGTHGACGRGAQLPNCATGKSCQLKCKGQAVCNNLKGRGATGHWDKITCNTPAGGWPACQSAAMPGCPNNSRCELSCVGRGTCTRLKPLLAGKAGSTVDISAGKNLPKSAVPKPAALSSKMLAFRVSGVLGYHWPPKQCKGASKSSWYCPGTRMCAKSERDCGGGVKNRWGKALGKKGPKKDTHKVSTEPHQFKIGVMQRNKKKQVTVRVFGKKVRTRVPIRVMEDAGAGYQGLSGMQFGGLRTLAGTMIDVTPGQVIFTLPEEARPNHCTFVLSPVILKDESVQPILVETCHSGRAELTLPPDVQRARGRSSSGLSGAKLV